MYSLLISFLPFILIIYYMIDMRRRDFVSYYMNNGVRCYCCKELFFDFDKDYFKNFKKVEDSGMRKLRLCTSCDREKSINILFSSKKDQFVLSLKRFMLTDRYHRIQRIVTIGCLLLPLLSLVFKFAFKTETYLTEISSLINCVIWGFMIYHMKSTTVPKNKTQTSA